MMFLKKMKILDFIKRKLMFKKNKTKETDEELIEKERWLEGEGPQTD